MVWVNTYEPTGACGVNKAKTHCIRGHPFSPENTYRRPDGQRACRECARAQGLKCRAQAYDRRRGTLESWLRVTLINIKSKSKRLGIPFSVTVEDFRPLPEVCPVFGVPFTLETKTPIPHNGPSVDRVIPERGYVPGNVKIISRRANLMKNDCADPQQFILLAEYMRTHLDQERSRE
jgi:hypothetical protein